MTLLRGQLPPARLGLPLSPLPAWGMVGPTAAWRCNGGAFEDGSHSCLLQAVLGNWGWGDAMGVWERRVWTLKKGSKQVPGREPARIKQHQGIPWDLGAP